VDTNFFVYLTFLCVATQEKCNTKTVQLSDNPMVLYVAEAASGEGDVVCKQV
jgi:hypothetical protein